MKTYDITKGETGGVIDNAVLGDSILVLGRKEAIDTYEVTRVATFNNHLIYGVPSRYITAHIIKKNGDMGKKYIKINYTFDSDSGDWITQLKVKTK